MHCFFSRENDAFVRAGRRVVARHRGVSFFSVRLSHSWKGMSAESGYVSGKAGNCLLVQETECPAVQENRVFVPAECCGKMDFYSHSLTYTITNYNYS